MKTLKEAFGFRLKEIRKSKKYSQETLAELIDLSPRQLIRIENGENFPSTETIERIICALDIELDNLFDFRGNKDAMYFNVKSKNQPIAKITKKDNKAIIKFKKNTLKADFKINSTLNINEYEKKLLELSKKTNLPIVAEIFDNKERKAINIFHPDNRIEEIINDEDIERNELYNYIITKLKLISADKNKLNYLKTAIDSLENKEALNQIKILIKGMELMM